MATATNGSERIHTFKVTTSKYRKYVKCIKTKTQDGKDVVMFDVYSKQAKK